MASARGAALRALVAVERGRSERLRSVLDDAGLEGRDAGFANELAHGVLRRERLLDHVVRAFAQRGLPKDPALLCALRLGAYQLTFVGGVPAHAAVHETVELVRQNRSFANAILRRIADCIAPRSADPSAVTTEVPLSPTRTLVLPRPLPDDEVARLAILHSLPDFLAARFRHQHGIDGLRTIAGAASAVPAVFLRAVGGSRDDLRAALAAEGVECEPAANPTALKWSGGGSPFVTESFRRGRFVVQDPTAIAAALAVPCRAGATVVDLCAAPGTKTTLLAERVRPGGRVFAFDPDEARRRRIVENVARLGFADTVTVVEDPARLTEADAVLADVPCSNTGVLGRRVEVRRRIRPTTMAEMARVQSGILDRAMSLVRPGGALVYSTCSIDREENEEQVAAALARPAAAGFSVVGQQIVLPMAGEHDGGFHAVLRRALPGSAADG